jgi:hypothetical protein
MWAGLVERGLGITADRVECETAGCADGHSSCRIRLRLRAHEASASGETESR